MVVKYLSVSGRAASTNNLFETRLVIEGDSRRRFKETCCDSKHAKTCLYVDINPEVLLSEADLTIDQITLQFSHTIPPRGRVYQTEAGDEAISSRNNQTGSIIGTLKTHDGRSFALEKCNDSYIFQQFNVASFPTDEVIDEGDFDPTLIVAPDTRSGSSYTYSIMFYYTAEFAAVTPNIEDFIDQVIAETNQGYANSEISITVTKLCQELATVPDQTDARALLREFKQMKGTVSELRNTADAAALLSVDISHCGMAYMATATSGNTLSVTKKSCALGYYSFGHEVAHNLGASHNKEVATNNNFDDGHAHLIEKGAASTGYRTILGYYSDGHDIRVNYYSNPAVMS